MEKNFVVGVDVGGQTTKIGVVDKKGKILSQTVIRSDIFGSDEMKYLQALADAINNVIAESGKAGQIRGVGVGAPNGNYYQGTVFNAPNLAWAVGKNVEFAKILSANLGGIPVSLTNDANAAAIGEMTYGATKGMKNFIMITLGTGVGSGIIIDGKLVYGNDGFAGELGHTTAIRGGRPCNCGLKGCLEAYCSAIGVARTAREWLETRSEASLLRNVENISSKDVYDAAKMGDKLAKEIFDYTGTLLGQSFANFIAFSAPEAIVLFGGLARSKEFLTEPILKAMNENLLPTWKNKVKLIYSSLKESDAAILGASALAWEL
ncbi:MAG: ROK family protein [Bacteroidales bacterium]|nr:ROK family protein [Bacteroidales bacterium]